MPTTQQPTDLDGYDIAAEPEDESPFSEADHLYKEDPCDASKRDRESSNWRSEGAGGAPKHYLPKEDF